MTSHGIIAGRRRNRGRSGSAMIEFCLLMPWYIFLFIGTFDFGFYAYSLIGTTAAARVAAANCSASLNHCTSATACTNYVVPQLADMPNIGTKVTTCAAAPLTVTVSYPVASSCPDLNTCATVTVTYVTPQLIPITNVLPGQVTVTKTVTMRLLS